MKLESETFIVTSPEIATRNLLFHTSCYQLDPKVCNIWVIITTTSKDLPVFFFY